MGGMINPLSKNDLWRCNTTLFGIVGRNESSLLPLLDDLHDYEMKEGEIEEGEI